MATSRAVLVPSCSEEEDQISVVDFMQDVQDENQLSLLYAKWTDMLKENKIPVPVRKNCDNWFQKCYKERKNISKLKKDMLHKLASQKEEQLFNDFQETYKNHEDFFVKMECCKVLSDFPESSDWVKTAAVCVEKEICLMDEFNQTQEKNRCREVSEKMIQEVQTVAQWEERIKILLEEITNDKDALDSYKSKRMDAEDHMKDFTRLKRARGASKNMKKLEEEAASYQAAHNFDKDIERYEKKVEEGRQKIPTLFYDLHQCMTNFVQELINQVARWRDDFKHHYVEIGKKCPLDELADWCGRTGRSLNHIILSMDKLSVFVAGLSVEQQALCSQLLDNLKLLWRNFLSSTFVVTEQSEYIVKVDKKNLPKISVRILAADKLSIAKHVQAYFLLEENINKCIHGDRLSEEKLKEEQIPMDGSKGTFSQNKTCEAVFKNMKFKRQFTRPGKKQVHEEKYRVVMVTNIEGHQFQTLSLPLVVTTGANQNCHALASVMWQCFSTDVYALPIELDKDLTWSDVAKMLNMKMLKLCEKRPLTDENINHLKQRLLGSPDKPDDTCVSLRKFCYDKMERTERNERNETCSFTFWKWFLANYNLVEKYLLHFWEDGLIVGYLSKEDAVKKMEKCRNGESGIFFLRFSDQNIMDSQGIRSVFGHLTSCVMKKIVDVDGVRSVEIRHLDVAGHGKLKDKNLAKILKGTRYDDHSRTYCYLYPGNQRREDVFDKYLEKDTVVEGYIETEDEFVVRLNQALCALSLRTGKHRSPSMDSGIASPASTCGNGNGKRSRGLAEEYPNISSHLSHPAGCFSPQADTFSNISSPPKAFSPAMSDFNPSNPHQFHMDNGDSELPPTSEALLVEYNIQNGMFQQGDNFTVSEDSMRQMPVNSSNIPLVVEEVSKDFQIQSHQTRVTMSQQCPVAADLTSALASAMISTPPVMYGAPSPVEEVEVSSQRHIQYQETVPPENILIYSMDNNNLQMDNTPHDFMFSNSGGSDLQLSDTEMDRNLEMDSGSMDTTVIDNILHSQILG